MATDAAGNVYVADSFNSRIQKFTSAGTYLTQLGGPGHEDGQFNEPEGVGTDAAGNVYVADAYNNRIQMFGSSPTPVNSVTWGSLKSRYRGAPGAPQPAPGR